MPGLLEHFESIQIGIGELTRQQKCEVLGQWRRSVKAGSIEVNYEDWYIRTRLVCHWLGRRRGYRFRYRSGVAGRIACLAESFLSLTAGANHPV